MASTAQLQCLFKIVFFILIMTIEAKATVGVVRFGSGTNVQVCQAGDLNPACGSGSSGGSGTVGIGTVNNFAGYVGISTIGPFQTVEVAGNVGIGSLMPGTALDVVGTVRSTGFTTTGGYTQTGVSGNIFSGNTGIGTTVPAAQLYLYAPANAVTLDLRSDLTSASSQIRFRSDNNVFYGNLVNNSGAGNTTLRTIPLSYVISARGGATGGLLLGSEDTTFGNIMLYTGGFAFSNERMRVDVAGNVGIGTVNPVNKLVVAGGVSVGTNSNSSFVQTSAPSGGLLVQGNTGIGTITTSLAKLNVFGDINVKGTAAGLTGFNLSNIDVAGTKDGAYFTGSYLGSSNLFVGSSGGTRQIILAPNTVGMGATTTVVWSNSSLGWYAGGSDTGLSRFTAGVVAVGNATNLDTSGALVAANIGIGTTNIANGRLLITGGNVGIGSINPGTALDVANNLRVRNADSSTNTIVGLTKLGSSTFAAASLLDIYGSSVTAGKLLYRSVAGNVIVAVQEGSLGGDYGDIFVNGTGGTNKMDFSGASGINNSLGYTQSGSSFNTFTGNVGIGSATPGVALDVTGSIRSSTGTVGQATCWKSDKTLGQCTSVVGVGGACTCS